MPAFSIKHLLSIVVSVLLIFTLFITAWLMPQAGITLGLIFLLFGLAATSYTIVRKNREAYLQGKIPRSVSTRNICLEIAAILVAMVLAGLLGRHLSGVAAAGLNSMPARLLAGIAIGLLAGWAVGLLISMVSGRLVKPSSGE